MAKENTGRGVSVGLSSIAVMFVVIAMTIFAVLAVSTASQERELAEKYAASVNDYWAADGECAEIANALGELWESGAEAPELEALAKSLGAECSQAEGELAVSFSRPIGETQRLCVTLLMGGEFKIAEWRAVPGDGDWTPDTSIPVWQG